MSEGPIAKAFVEILPAVDAAQFGRQIKAGVVPLAGAAGHAAAQAFEKNFQVDAQGKFRTLDGRFTSTQKVAQVTSKAIYDDFHGAFDRIAASARLDTDRVIASLDRIGRSAAQSAAQARTSMGTIGGATRHASKEVGFLSSRYSALPRVIRQAEIAAVAALGAVGAFGITAAAKLEQTQVAFTGLLGTQDAADAFIKRLQDFAATTPFEFEDLAKSTQKLIALGKSGDEALSIMTDIGNAAAAAGASGESINRVTLAITQMQAKGKFLAEELNQVAEALPNLDRGKIFENLAKQSGLTTEQVKELAAKGAIPAKEGIDALLQSLREVPGAMGAMDRQAVTLIGRFSTFKDTIKQDFSSSLQDSIPIISNSLSSLTDVVDQQLKSFGPALGEFIGSATPLISALVNAIGPIATVLLQQLGPLLAALAPGLTALGTAIASLLQGVGPVLTVLAGGLSSVLVAVEPLVTALAGSLGPVLAEIATALVGVITDLLPSFQQVLGQVVVALGPFLEALGHILIAVAPILPQFAEISIELLPLLVTVLTALSPLLELVAQLITALGPALQVPIMAIRVLVDILNFLLKTILLVFSSIITGAAKAFGWIPGIGDKLKDAKKAFDGFRDEVNESLAGINGNIPITITVTGELSAAEVAASQKRSALINQAINDATGGHPNLLAPEDRAAIVAKVDASIAAATSAVKKAAPATASTLADVYSTATDKATKGAASKAASAAQTAAQKAADAAIKNAKAVADGIRKQLDTARQGLADLRKQFDDIRKSVSEAFNIDVFESRSAKQLVSRLTKNISKNQTVLAAQRTLQASLGGKTGGATFLTQLFESGNTKLIKKLAGESSATLANILAKFNQNNSLADKIGLAVAKASEVGGRPLTTAIAKQTAAIVALHKALIIALGKVEAATRARARLKAAAGGLFTSATDIQVGEAGREIVLPFARPGRMEEIIKESGLLRHPVLLKMMQPDFIKHDAFSKSLPPLKASVPVLTRSLNGGSTPAPLRSVPPIVKVVKERTVNLEQHIHGASDPHQTADRAFSRIAGWAER